MRTAEWIGKNAGREGRQKFFSSVLKGSDGTIYSYGYHYPLLFKINNLWFVNRTGYSVTTSKHINWAYSASHYTAYGLKVPHQHEGPVTFSQAESWLLNEITELIVTMNNKRRKDTNVYLNLQRDLRQANKALKALEGTI